MNAIAAAPETPAPLLPLGLGLIGAALVWREIAAATAVPPWAAEALVAAAALALTALLIGYLRRLRRRPSAVDVDLRRRAGAPGGTEALMFLGVALAPLSAGLGALVWMGAAAAQIALALRLFLRHGDVVRRDPELSLFLIVPFGGMMLAPVAFAPALFWIGLALGAATWPLALRRLLLRPTPPDQRPAAWVLLAPPSVACIAALSQWGAGPLAFTLFALATGTLVGLTWRLPWIAEGGFAPSWPCFTYPSAAYAGACAGMAAALEGGGWTTLAVVAAALVTAATLTVAALCLSAWRAGRLRRVRAAAPSRG
ncbi:MAG: hypothetical protein ACK4WC_06240 [Rubrimonas sp.]